MAIRLQKGQKIDLSKKFHINNCIVGLGWDENQFDGGYDFDLDASAFLLNNKGRCQRDTDFIFYNNLKHPSGCITHTGDDRTGGNSEDGDDEQLIVNLNKVPNDIHEIVFVVTIDDAERRKQNFGQVTNSYIRIIDQDTDKEILRYGLEDDFSTETAVTFARLYRKNDGWNFDAIGRGFTNGLAAMVEYYGLEVE